MNRRLFLGRSAALATAAGLSAPALAQGLAGSLDYAAPERLVRPEVTTEEGGLWGLMDREEKNLRRSPLLLRDPELKRYVQELACRLAGEHCPDLRIFLLRTPLFNASMAPNGMMQVWSGLLLRVENEAQLAAVLGHEIGHYLQRHSLERMRDVKAKSAFGQFVGLFGAVGALGQLAVLASAFAYGRDHEREADRIGAVLMHRAGFDVGEAAVVWRNLQSEQAGAPGAGKPNPLFATHPPSPEREENLRSYASTLPGGDKGEAPYLLRLRPHLDMLLQDEIHRGQFGETLALFARLRQREEFSALIDFYRGELYRQRGQDGDQELALADYRRATQAPSPPAAAFRGIGLIARQRGRNDEARAAFSRYLELAPEAPDAAFIRNYLTELPS
ncbi:MAG: hypothetical protein RIR00_2594 [Pseudomonadota bacterium]